MFDFSDGDDRIRSKFDERNPHDSHHIPILQHIRENDVIVCEGDQSDDLNLQGVHQ